MPNDLCPVALHARRFPDRTALSWSGRSIAWDAFNNYVHSTSRYLKEISVRPQARVLVVTERSPAFVIVLLALWRIRALPCPVDPDSLSRQPSSIFAVVQPELVISARSVRKIFGPKVRWADIEQVVAYGYNDSFLGSASALDPMIDTDQVALLCLRIAADIISIDPLTHQQLKESPENLKALLDALITGETYTI